MELIPVQPWWKSFFEEAGDQVLFLRRVLKNTFRDGFEWNELIRQCFIAGYRSLPLVANKFYASCMVQYLWHWAIKQ